MDNVKFFFIYCIYIFLILFYLMFVGIDHNYLKKIQSKNIELEVQNINNFITKNKKIDAIILGGSNAVQGLSAEQLSEITTKKFYNLSLDYEGGNNFDYYNRY